MPYHARSPGDAGEAERGAPEPSWSRGLAVLCFVVSGLAGCTGVVTTNLSAQVVGSEYGAPSEATAAFVIAGIALVCGIVAMARHGNGRDWRDPDEYDDD